jgi:hypothetical protein
MIDRRLLSLIAGQWLIVGRQFMMDGRRLLIVGERFMTNGRLLIVGIVGRSLVVGRMLIVGRSSVVGRMLSVGRQFMMDGGSSSEKESTCIPYVITCA